MTTKTHIQKLGRMIAVLTVVAMAAAPVASADAGIPLSTGLSPAVSAAATAAGLPYGVDFVDPAHPEWGTFNLPIAPQGDQAGDALDRYLRNAASAARPDDRAVLPRVETPTTISAAGASLVDWGRLGISVGVGGAVLLILGMAFTTRRRLAHS